MGGGGGGWEGGGAMCTTTSSLRAKLCPVRTIAERRKPVWFGKGGATVHREYVLPAKVMKKTT